MASTPIPNESIATSNGSDPSENAASQSHDGNLPATFLPDDSMLPQEQTVMEREGGAELDEKGLPRSIKYLEGLGLQETGTSHRTEEERQRPSSPFILDPLRTSQDKKDACEMAVDEEDSTPEKTSPTARSQHTSHLRLNIKPPSPQPWELVEPPTTYSSAHQKLQAFQGIAFEAVSTRPSIPKSSYYFGPPPSDAAFGTPPVGQIGVHHPREIIRIERDYTGGELTQFAPIYPLELEGRLTPTHFLESINAINELLISAHSIRHSFWDNVHAVFTFQLSRLFLTSHYEKEMSRLQRLIEELNSALYNPVGLNILWPRDVAFLFLEIEYY